MNEKTARQIAEMKNQTIGVEVEMNSITRHEGSEGCRRLTSAQADTRTPPAATATSTWTRLGRTGARVEIPEGRFSIAGPDEREMRTGHPDPAPTGTSKPCRSLCRQLRHGRSEKRRHQRLRSPHPHRGAGPHTAEPSKPRQHHGEPRKPDRRSAEARPQPHEPLLPHGRPKFPRSRSTAESPARWRSLRTSGTAAHGRKLRQEPPLQRQPLPYAQPPRHLYQRARSSSGFSSSTSRPQSASRAALHAGQLKSYIQLCLALSQMAKDVRTRKPQAPAERKTPSTPCAPGSSAWASSARSSQRPEIS